MLKKLSQMISVALVATLISACDIAVKDLPLAPGVITLKINEESTVDNKGWIITEAQSIKLEIIFLTDFQVPVKRINVQRKRNGTDEWLDISGCSEGPGCQVWNWPVSKACNGIYSLKVTVEDEREASVSLPFHNSIAIDIQDGTTVVPNEGC